jgi:hypothetical protein
MCICVHALSASALAAVLPRNTSTAHLVLAGNALGRKGWLALAGACEFVFDVITRDVDVVVLNVHTCRRIS